MLGVLMLNEIGGEVHDADIVTVDKCALKRCTLESMEQLTQSGGLYYVVGDDVVLSLRAGSRDDRLSLGRPGHRLVPQEHHIAGHRAVSV
jgi:hypothetical protein